MQYIRLWVDSLHNIKLWRMDLAQRGAWFGLCTIAGECDKEGRLEKGGHPLTVDEIIEMLHVKSGKDKKAVESMIDIMEKAGSLNWNDGHVLVVTHFHKRNATVPSATKEAVGDRVKLHRDREKKLQESRKVDKKLAEFCQIYESNIGIITPMMGEELKDLSTQYPMEWFQEAVKLACANNARKLSYVKAILSRWQVEGFKSGKNKKGQKAKTTQFSDVGVIKSGEENG